MTLVRFIDRLVSLIDSLFAEGGRRLHLAVAILVLGVALIGVLGITVLMAWLGAMS